MHCFYFWTGKQNIAQVPLPLGSVFLSWNVATMTLRIIIIILLTDWPEIILLTACATIKKLPSPYRNIGGKFSPSRCHVGIWKALKFTFWGLFVRICLILVLLYKKIKIPQQNPENIWVKVFKNGLSKRLLGPHLRGKNFTWSILEYLYPYVLYLSRPSWYSQDSPAKLFSHIQMVGK